MILELNVFAPSSLPDGVGTYHVEVKTPNQTDTVVFILTKQQGTGLADVQVAKDQFEVFPNPNSGDFSIFAARSLNLKMAALTNLMGQKVQTIALDTQSEVTKMSVQNIPVGIYLLQVFDDQGSLVKSKKVFIK